jgi:cytochrome P450
MLNDPRVFPNPSEFRPERFLGAGKQGDVPANPSELAFGFGRRWARFLVSVWYSIQPSCSRRICPGQHLAEPFLFLSVAMTLAAFTITKALDDHGNIIDPEIEWMPGTIRFEGFWLIFVFRQL